MESAKIERNLVWMGIESPEEAILDLRRAQCVAIWDEEDSWPSAGNLFLDGFAYKSICEDAPPDAASRIRWLHLQPRDKFLPQPYEQLADVLRQSGHEEEARKILIQKGKDAGRTLPDFRWFVHWLFGLTAAYGHRPLKAFGWIVFFMLLGWVAFGIAHEANLMVETKIAERIDDGTATDCSVTSEYPEFDALIYSMDTFIPVIDLGQACYWQPSSMRMAEWRPLASVALPVNGMMALVYQRFHTIFGWALTTLFILGLTGLLKK